MLEIDKGITEIVNRYDGEGDSVISPSRYVEQDDDNYTEYELSVEISDYLESQRKLGNIKEYSVEDEMIHDSCSRADGVCSVACIGNNNELYHRVIDWHIF